MTLNDYLEFLQTHSKTL